MYQVTHGTALQAAERHVRHLSCEDGAWKLSEDMCGIRDDCTLMMSCRGRICVSLSEGNAKTGLEQSPLTDSPKAYGPHKSTVTTHRSSVQSVLSVESVVERRKPEDRLLTGP